MLSETISRAFCLLIIFLLIRSNFCLKLISVFCNIVVNVCLHPLSKITSGKDVFLHILLWNVQIICDSTIEIWTQKIGSLSTINIVSYVPLETSNITGWKMFQSTLFSFLMKFTSRQWIKSHFRHFNKYLSMMKYNFRYTYPYKKLFTS